jgi:acyl-coenzyme A thioesterase PaaI-like protein
LTSGSNKGAERDPSFLDLPHVVSSVPWDGKRRLAAALRELMAVCVTSDAPTEDFDRAADAVSAAAQALRQHPGRTYLDAFVGGTAAEDAAQFADRNVLMGKANPLAPPIALHAEDELIVGLVTFGPSYEGAPGFVHGGFIAAAFDQVFGYVQSHRRVISLTGNLTTHYHRPTPINTELRFEAHCKRVDGRKHFVVGTLLVDGNVTARGESVFVAIDPTQARAMFEAQAK